MPGCGGLEIQCGDLREKTETNFRFLRKFQRSGAVEFAMRPRGPQAAGIRPRKPTALRKKRKLPIKFSQFKPRHGKDGTAKVPSHFNRFSTLYIPKYTIFPSITVNTTEASLISLASAANRFRSTTARSASFPSCRAPISSLPYALAAPDV